MLTIILNSCQYESKDNLVDFYPQEVIDSNLVEVFSEAKWGFYKYYQDCPLFFVDISKEVYDTLKVTPLFYHDINCVRDLDSKDNFYSFSFYVSNDSSRITYYPIVEKECFGKDMGSPLYNFFIDKITKQVTKIEYIEQRFIKDTNWINNILYSPDERFVEKLLQHQDSITPWLRNELILRGYLEE